MPGLTEERDDRELARPVNWFVGNFICLIDSIFFFCPCNFESWQTILFPYLIDFYFTLISLTTWELWDIHISFDGCHIPQWHHVLECILLHLVSYLCFCHNEMHFKNIEPWMIHWIPLVHFSPGHFLIVCFNFTQNVKWTGNCVFRLELFCLQQLHLYFLVSFLLFCECYIVFRHTLYFLWNKN